MSAGLFSVVLINDSLLYIFTTLSANEKVAWVYEYIICKTTNIYTVPVIKNNGKGQYTVLKDVTMNLSDKLL